MSLRFLAYLKHTLSIPCVSFAFFQNLNNRYIFARTNKAALTHTRKHRLLVGYVLRMGFTPPPYRRTSHNTNHLHESLRIICRVPEHGFSISRQRYNIFFEYANFSVIFCNLVKIFGGLKAVWWPCGSRVCIFLEM